MKYLLVIGLCSIVFIGVAQNKKEAYFNRVYKLEENGCKYTISFKSEKKGSYMKRCEDYDAALKRRSIREISSYEFDITEVKSNTYQGVINQTMVQFSFDTDKGTPKMEWHYGSSKELELNAVPEK